MQLRCGAHARSVSYVHARYADGCGRSGRCGPPLPTLVRRQRCWRLPPSDVRGAAVAARRSECLVEGAGEERLLGGTLLLEDKTLTDGWVLVNASGVITSRL